MTGVQRRRRLDCQPPLRESVVAQWELSGKSARREVSEDKLSAGWRDDVRVEVDRTVEAKQMGRRSGSSSDENREPPFGIEKADIEGNRGRSFPRTSPWGRNSLKVGGW